MEKNLMWKKIKEKTLQGEGISQEEAYYLASWPMEKLGEIFYLSRQVRERFGGRNVELCAIINARSGLCSEDCHFCAQSSRFKTGVEVYPLIDVEKALEKAQRMEAAGVKRFALVTSGKGIGERDFEKVLEIYQVLKTKTRLKLCASLGIIDEEKARRLKEVGVTSYHHNLETGRSYFSKICTTHTFEERVATIQAARNAGLNICSGGIIGLGEIMEHRLEMIFELKKLGVMSVPVNILNPIPGTPLANQERLSIEEILKTLILFRLIIPRAVFRLCGGRERGLGENQKEALVMAVNGLMVGNYLTTWGNRIQEDLDMIAEVGLKVLV
ncbi:biotin synthase BioB [Thermoanaerobacter kivui]|uniref:Biotin synthase n=1 Tax=Thermoanaerobacter kivui TaxID=2325 RepID=A0A097AQ29_THEKI|nr:biotin synthase BioB [Thermoanaerobacter kivui]AIS51921.1 biotin synthase BioB [Thermoanaerobacter kivui]